MTENVIQRKLTAILSMDVKLFFDSLTEFFEFFFCNLLKSLGATFSEHLKVVPQNVVLAVD